MHTLQTPRRDFFKLAELVTSLPTAVVHSTPGADHRLFIDRLDPSFCLRRTIGRSGLVNSVAVAVGGRADGFMGSVYVPGMPEQDFNDEMATEYLKSMQDATTGGPRIIIPASTVIRVMLECGVSIPSIIS